MEPHPQIASDTRAMLPGAAPTFYLTGRQRIHPGAILLAIVAAVAFVGTIVYAMNHSRGAHLLSDPSGSSHSAGSASGSASEDDKDDDPNQIDTIVLGDPSEAPMPAHPGTSRNHVSSVHPTVLIVLPRSGERFGQIPNTGAGRLLYAWLAAFNKPSSPELAAALPTAEPARVVAFQMQLRQQTGGYTLLSAREVQPGVLVFRLRDQTRAGNEALGTLLADPNSNPPAIASFSLRAVPPPTSSTSQAHPQ